jgi:hypothetical protein
MRLELDGLEVCADEWRERCSTAIENVSGYVVVVISVLESRAVTLVSGYLADVGGETAVSQMRLTSGASAAFSQRMLRAMPGQTHARACLLDHAAELRELLDDLFEEDVSVELSEHALERAAGVWRPPAG